MNREWTNEDELRHENRRLAAEVAELRVRAEAAEAWCESWKRGAGISSRERDEALAACRLSHEALMGAVPFGTNPDARDRARRAIDQAGAALMGILFPLPAQPASGDAPTLGAPRT